MSTTATIIAILWLKSGVKRENFVVKILKILLAKSAGKLVKFNKTYLLNDLRLNFFGLVWMFEKLLGDVLGSQDLVPSQSCSMATIVDY
jgi:hypothetical protein